MSNALPQLNYKKNNVYVKHLHQMPKNKKLKDLGGVGVLHQFLFSKAIGEHNIQQIESCN